MGLLSWVLSLSLRGSELIPNRLKVLFLSARYIGENFGEQKPLKVIPLGICEDKVVCSWLSIPVDVTKKLVSTNKDLPVPRNIDEILRKWEWFVGVLVRKSSIEFLADDNCSSHTSLLRALTSGDPQFNVLRTCNPTDIFLCFKLFKDRGLSFTLGCNGEFFVETDPYFYEAGPTVGCPNFLDMIQQLSVFQDVACFFNCIISPSVYPASNYQIHIRFFFKVVLAKMWLSGGSGGARRPRGSRERSG